MSHPKKTEIYINQGAVNSPLGNSLSVNDYFRGSTTMAFEFWCDCPGILAGVALSGRDKVDSAVAMLVVIPSD
jgi:hypothetical protein